MKLLHAANITATTKHESKDVRRGDLFNWITGEYPPDVGDGPPEEIVSRVHDNGTETLEIEDAATDMNDLAELEHNGRKYRITEAKRSRQYGFWDSLKCVRALVDGL
jgi:hypothetical protein